MAVLSVGAALAPVTNLFAAQSRRTDLKQLWNIFCRKNGGHACDEPIDRELPPIAVCQGHFYQAGKPVYFPEENLLAQPMWIYWNEAMRSPDDIVISFFENGEDKKKLFSLNCFELETINSLKYDEIHHNSLRILKEYRRAGNTGQKQAGGLSMKTRITRQKAQTAVTLMQENIILKDNIIHHI
jgi:hypothetical protein